MGKLLDRLNSLVFEDPFELEELRRLKGALDGLPSEIHAWLEEDRLPSVDPSIAAIIREKSDIPTLELDPGNQKFETVADAPNWAKHCRRAKLQEKRERWLGAPDPNTMKAVELFDKRDPPGEDFRYSLNGIGTQRGPVGDTVEIALFADFGTGLPHSQHIAHQITKRAPHYAFHLGDVYYCGTEAEYRENFVRPLRELVKVSKLFNLAGNHDRYSGNEFFYREMDDRRRQFSNLQEQQGSYFRLVSGQYQIIGLDTNTVGVARFEQVNWLTKALEESRDHDLTTILLSSEHPYDHVDPLILKNGATELYKDVARAQVAGKGIFSSREPTASPVHLWFWGNIHYAAFFDPYFDHKHNFPFYGSCIGHGGYPYYRMIKPIGHDFVRWVETAPRYPKVGGKQIRPAMGNNGFCMMRLKPSGVELEYVDWRGKTRCMVALARSASGCLKATSLDARPDPELD